MLFSVKGRRVIKLSEDAATCPSTYEAVGEGCYFVSNTTSSSWYQAVKQCANMNGYLATISTEEENTALKQYLATLTCKYCSRQSCWFFPVSGNG